MPLTADGPPRAGRADDLSDGLPAAWDPARGVVHAMLAIYLAPVILLVCLIGAVTIPVGGSARMLRRLGSRLTGRDDSRSDAVFPRGEVTNEPRLAYRRPRSRSFR